MKFLDHPHFWTILWTVYTILLLSFIPWDVLAVIRGNHDKVGDSFTYTHWLLKYIGLSVIGAAVGYLVFHFGIVHRDGS